MSNPDITAGLGLKPQHFDAALENADAGIWFEVHPENYLVDGGPRRALLECIRTRHPVSLHGVSLSLAADVAPDQAHLERLAALVQQIEPVLVSEHLAWSAWRGMYLPDLLPFPRTQAALSRIAGNIACTQDALGRRIAIENPSHYVTIPGHDWDEIDFLSELSRRTGCGLLLDVNNVYVSASNQGYSAETYIDKFPTGALMEIHLAGHSLDPQLGNGLLIDSHDAPIAPEVWCLYERLISRCGPCPTLIERDEQIPTFADLLMERRKAHALLRNTDLACV
jgi:uncharacterized protein (UPF0276 family)